MAKHTHRGGENAHRRQIVRLLTLALFVSILVVALPQMAKASPFRTGNREGKKRQRGETSAKPSTTKGPSTFTTKETTTRSVGTRARSVIVNNHQPLVDERLTLDSAARHHLSFVDPNSLSEFVVDNIAEEVLFLKKTIPSFEKTCLELEGPDVDSEDALLRCLKRVYFPTHPIYTGRSAMHQNVIEYVSHAGLPAPTTDSASEEVHAKGDGGKEEGKKMADFADGIGTPREGASHSESEANNLAKVELSALDEDVLMSTNGWMPTQIANGSIYMCRMPRANDNELIETEEKTFVPKPKAKATKAEGSDDGEGSAADKDEDPQTIEQLKPGQKLPRALRLELSRRMRGSRCATKSAGWWMYEVCWEDHVRQYHQEGAKVTTSHYLGQGPNKRIKDGTLADDVYFNVHSVRGPYLSQTLLNGSTCDVTGEPRIAEIRLFCDENAGNVRAVDVGLPDQAASAINLHVQNVEVSEPETCTYLVWMGSPKACLKQTRKRQGPIFGVRCRNVDDL